MKLLTDNSLGTVPLPSPLGLFGDVNDGGIGIFLQLILKLLIVGGGIYALFNLVLAGYAFMSAGDDPKKMEGAWAKIWQTAIGLLFMAGAFVLAAIFGQLIFGSWTYILQPQIPTLY
jgi:hypothetical protein